MKEKEEKTKEDLRKDMKRRILSDRRESLLPYELLNYEKPDSRNEPNRRSGKDRRINKTKEE